MANISEPIAATTRQEVFNFVAANGQGYSHIQIACNYCLIRVEKQLKIIE